MLPSQADTDRPTANIINGKDIPITDAPWQVGLLSVKYGLRQFCGGSLIDEQWVLTAAHCVSDIPWLRGPDDIEIVAGATDLSATPIPSYEAELIIAHPDYDAARFTNDVALIKLAAPLPLNGTTMAPIALPTENPAAWPAKGTQAFISGWGNTSTTELKYPDLLQGAFVEIITSPTGPFCGQYPTDEYRPLQMLCAGTILDPLTDTCQGDSGGPLAVNVAGTWTLAGITSWGEGCAQPGYPGVYTRVTTYTSWIASIRATDWGQLMGTVDTANGPVDDGRVEFYPTCQHWQDRTPTAVGTLTETFTVTVPAGEYRVRIVPGPGQRALPSWHSGAGSCADATVVTIAAGPNITTLRGVQATKVTGSVFDEQNRRIESGSLEFYATCEDWERGKTVAQTSFTGLYTISVPAGIYRIRVVNHDPDSGAVASWNSAKADCQSADPVKVPATAEDYALRLEALSTAPAPTPTPTQTPVVKTDQTVKHPPAKVKKGKRIDLAARTNQGQKVTWQSKTTAVCAVSKHTLRTTKKGTCRLVAQAPGTTTLNSFTQRFTTTVKKGSR